MRTTGHNNTRTRLHAKGASAARVAVLGALTAATVALPTSAAGAAVEAKADLNTPGAALPISGSLPVGVLDPSGKATEVLHDLTLSQLASLLQTTPSTLVGQLESAAGNNPLSQLLTGLLGKPGTTLGEVLSAGGPSGSVAAVQKLVSELLAPLTGTSTQLQGVVQQILEDLQANGKLTGLAEQLGVPVSVLEAAHPEAVSAESVASTLGTSVDELSRRLTDAGALTTSLGRKASLVSIPVPGGSGGAGGGGGTTILGTTNEKGGVTLTTVNTSSDPSRAPTVSNAFTVLSVKIKRGVIVELVRVPSSGLVTVSASARGKAARRGAKNKPISVPRVARAVNAGTQTITLTPGKAFKKAHQVALSLTTTYTPTGGKAATRHTRTTLRRASRKR